MTNYANSLDQGTSCSHEFCYVCRAPWIKILKESNEAHEPDCKYHTANLAATRVHPAVRREAQAARARQASSIMRAVEAPDTNAVVRDQFQVPQILPGPRRDARPRARPANVTNKEESQEIEQQLTSSNQTQGSVSAIRERNHRPSEPMTPIRTPPNRNIIDLDTPPRVSAVRQRIAQLSLGDSQPTPATTPSSARQGRPTPFRNQSSRRNPNPPTPTPTPSRTVWRGPGHIFNIED